MALHHLISSQFPRDYLGLVGFSETARVLTAAATPGGVVGLRVRHQHAPRVHARPPAARPPDRQQADHHDHRRRADRPHHAERRRVLQLPAGARDGRGDVARGRAVHARGDPHQHVRARRHELRSRRSSRTDRDQPWTGVLHDATRRSATTCWSTSSSTNDSSHAVAAPAESRSRVADAITDGEGIVWESSGSPLRRRRRTSPRESCSPLREMPPCGHRDVVCENHIHVITRL